MNILYQFNEKYAPYACVSMTSLFVNNTEEDEIIIYALVESDVAARTREKLQRNAELYHRKIFFLDTVELVESMKKMGIPTYRGSYSANFKMFVTEFLDESVERLLYIDSDTIIEDSLHFFYYSDLQGKAIAMSIDTLGMRHKLQIGIREDEDYYNTGVILYDLKTWRAHCCEQKIIDFVKNAGRSYPAPDQDIINLALKGDILRADMRYNLQPHHMVYSYDALKRFFYSDCYYTAKEVESAMASPVILHTYRFLGQFPWHLDSLHPAARRFDQYLEKSVYRGAIRAETDNNGMTFKIERWLYTWMPKNVFLKIFEMNFAHFFKKAERLARKRKTSDKM